ncbi:hypothetical protein WL93_28560 [Burkholderia diffusa]|uniref:hypothetical protein n=1 Tax=Burkholderia diffusa TaxID=488732 RepID=UPI000757F9CF|nr:hypothetical protein [Burkholderia diffusa]KUZ16516.1 hypothetical protein WI28_07060 [Burkholderia diffusa]KVC23627.1 hypothetical protein WI69_02765 [Burkholderia diffusa]KVC50089.1 hypothetical protein WI71_05025 [Burkholderia diffusa]KVH46838.1 hypothetical protein WJ39_16255 [Burkholderia diffusa]KWF75758.1 hypothetical protein WL93_28560 [Burkholderia diffusa]
MLILDRFFPAIAAGAILCAAANPAAAQQHPALDTAGIERITGLKGSYSEKEKVFEVSKPRDDVKIQIDDRAIRGAAAVSR